MMRQTPPVTVSEREMKMLTVLANHFHNVGNCLYFRYIAQLAGLDEKATRRAVRSLARKGLAEYVRGLFDDDGMVAGSGYCCTNAGHELFLARGGQSILCDDCGEPLADWSRPRCSHCEEYRAQSGEAA